MFTKKIWKKILPFVVAVVCLCAVSVPAVAEEIDPDRIGSISVSIRAYATDDAVGGGSLQLYQIAGTTVTAAEGAAYHYADGFSGCSEEFLSKEVLARAETADFFSVWVTEHEVAASGTATVSAQGQADFADLSCGLYLITQSEPADGYQPINAFLVSVPLNEDGTWIYEVDATPKTSPVTKDPTEEPKDEPKGEPGITSPGGQTPEGTGGRIGDTNPEGTDSSGDNVGTAAGGGRTGDVNYFVYGVLLIGGVLVLVVVLRKRANRRTR